MSVLENKKKVTKTQEAVWMVSPEKGNDPNSRLFFVLKFSAFNLICRLRCFKIKVIKHCGTGSTDWQRGKSRNESEKTAQCQNRS